MKLNLIIFIGGIASASAQPLEKLPCVDASRTTTYNARPISSHDVLVRNAVGFDKRSLRLSTTCIHIDRTAIISVKSLNQCIAKGDDVAAVSVDGQQEFCRVASVSLGQEYVGAKYK